ncbi:MAG: Rrf2 family transcriptional regulator [Clostridiales bacterium]|nr:Rrf2 family transcriptional regulator [Clostridiales bacterium]
MHITLESDYAIRIVYCLARANKRLDAHTISDQSSVSLRFSLKILRKLVTSGVVQSFKGAKGGYILAKNPEEITMREVIETVEGPYRFSRCLDSEYPCSHGGICDCPFQGVFDDISQTVREKLDQINFSMLLQNSCKNQWSVSQSKQD